MAELTDAQLLVRNARRLIVQFNHPSSGWTTLNTALVTEVTISAGSRPSTAEFVFPDLRWNTANPYNLYRGAEVVVITDDGIGTETILFWGFITNFGRSFGGGNQDGDAAESIRVRCADHRWLLAKTSPIVGIFARSIDDYDIDQQTNTWTPKDNQATLMLGRPVVFNADGRPDCDPIELTISGSSQYPGFNGTVPIHCRPGALNAQYWTIRRMLRNILSPLYNRPRSLTAFIDPPLMDQLHPDIFPDLDTVVHGLALPAGIAIPEAADRILSQIGYTYREDYYANAPAWAIYKPGYATATVRDRAAAPVIIQELYAPAPGENIADAVAAGERMVTGGDLDEDIDPAITSPWCIGETDLFETTFELVPAWIDTDLLVCDHVDEADLQQDANPDQYDFYKYYHTSGSQFRRDVGRKWALNEFGAYSDKLYYDRGPVFDFAAVCNPGLVDYDGYRNYGPFARKFLPCLTLDTGSLNSIGIKTEFSFDGGATWQTVQAAITCCRDECAIRITDPNLSDILPKNAGTITVNGKSVEHNYWTSLCRDNANSGDNPQAYYWPNWQTKVRVTACVQMDQRLSTWLAPTPAAGTPYAQTRVFDMSDRYGRKLRMTASQATGSAWQTPDHGDKLMAQAAYLQAANQDASVAGHLTLDRLWLGDGEGFPLFCCGDGVTAIRGRNLSLEAGGVGSGIFPEIVQIVYHVQQQQMDIILRDLKKARQKRDIDPTGSHKHKKRRR